MRIVVIGAGPTGLGVAYRLYQLQRDGMDVARNVELIVLEKELSAGGLSGTIMDKNGFFWDLGGHVTFDHNFPYYREAICWAVNEWNILQRNCQVDISYMFDEEGPHLVPYPVQYAIPLFPANIRTKCLNDLRDRCKIPEKTNSPKNFDDWIEEHFGPTLNNCFFKQYTRKVWTVTPDQMNPVWVGSRVAEIPYGKLEELCAMDEKDIKMIDIDAKNKLLTYRSERHGKVKLNYDILINTAPLDQLIKRTKLCKEPDLKYNKVFVIGIGLIKPVSKIAERFTWLYFPEERVPFYRVTFLSRYGEMTPNNDKYWCGLSNQLKRRVLQRDNELAHAHRVLEKHEIYSRGRFGGWKYEAANQDHCFIQGKELVDRLLLNIPETVYRNGLSTS